MTVPYKILCRGIFKENDILMRDTLIRKSYSNEVNLLIEQAWKDVSSNSEVFIFNGKVSCLDSWELVKDTLTVNYCESDYKSYYGTNIKNINKISDKNSLANTLAVCSVVETVDKKIIVGKRGKHLAEGRALWHVPGGTLEYYPERINHPFEVMKRELVEELNLHEIHDMICLGFGVNLSLNKPEFLLYTKTKLTSKEIEREISKASDYDEHSEIRFIDIKEINGFIQKHIFTEIGQAVLSLYLEHIEIKD